MQSMCTGNVWLLVITCWKREEELEQTCWGRKGWNFHNANSTADSFNSLRHPFLMTIFTRLNVDLENLLTHTVWMWLVINLAMLLPFERGVPAMSMMMTYLKLWIKHQTKQSSCHHQWNLWDDGTTGNQSAEKEKRSGGCPWCCSYLRLYLSTVQ